MKTKLMLTVLTGICLCGCAWLKSIDWIGVASSVAGQAAQEAVQRFPEQRNEFIAAKVALDGLIRDAKFTQADLAAALSKLKIREIQGLWLGPIVQIWDAATGTLLLPETQPAIAKVMTAIRDGFERGLAAPLLRTRSLPDKSDVPKVKTQLRI